MQAFIYWIEAHSTVGIAVITLLLTCAFALIVFGLATFLSRRGIGEELKMISPVTLTPLAVILGLLFAFLAARVWENVGHAQEAVGREIGALSEAVVLANAFPADIRDKLRADIRKHIEFIESEDWPAMGRFAASMRTEPVGLTSAMSTLLSFTPAQPQHQLAQQRALDAIAKAYEARGNRIRISHAEIAPIQWTVIFILTALIILTTGLIHMGRPRAKATTLVIFSTATAVCLTLLMVYDRPFAPGGITLDPNIYREINLD
jgi:Protein of unknown function (DUF4239)